MEGEGEGLEAAAEAEAEGPVEAECRTSLGLATLWVGAPEPWLYWVPWARAHSAVHR